MPKRPLLVVGAGVAIISVLEGIACGNPVAPRGAARRRPGDAGIDAAKP